MTPRSDRPRLALAVAVACLLSLLVAPAAIAQSDDRSSDEQATEPACGVANAPGDDGDGSDSEAEPPAGDDSEGDSNSEDADGDGAPRDNKKNRKNTKKNEADEAPAPEPCPPPQVSLADLVSPAPAATDLELQAALGTVGFLDTWYSVTSTHPRLSLVAVTSPDADAARAALFELLDELIENRETTTVLVNASQDTIAQRRVLERELEVAKANIAVLESEAATVEATIAGVDANLEVVLNTLTEAAVGLYVAEDQVGVGAMDDVENYNDQAELEIQVGATIDELFVQRDLLDTRLATQQVRLADVEASIVEAVASRDALQARIDALTETIEQLNERILALTNRRIEIERALPDSIATAQRERLLATAPGIGVSLVTLDAYVQAAEDIGDRNPSCVVRWELLAGIARVESAHATFGGARVAADGAVVGNVILGPLLDGTLEGTAVIEDTDGGRLDGNSEYDAAVGPFQFIPSTWRGYALDATGDGFADPHNLYDAALSAAGYLCASSNLANDDQIARSVLSYNQSLVYLADVTGFARDYITTLALPEAAYDPEALDPRDGWGVHFGEERPYEGLGLLGLPPGAVNAERIGQLAIPSANRPVPEQVLITEGD